MYVETLTSKLTSKQLFLQLPRKNSWPPDVLLTHELFRWLSTTNPEATNSSSLSHLFQNVSHFILSHSYPCLSTAAINSFKTTYIFFPQTHCMKDTVCPGQWSSLASPSSPASRGSNCMPQALILTLASIWLNKSITSR